MTKINIRILIICIFALSIIAMHGQNADSKSKLKFVDGPAKAQLGSIGRVDVPPAYRFLDGNSTRALMKAGGEPVSGQELGLLSPTNEDWSVLFEFSGVGYVKDDEKDKLDADKLLASIKRGTAEANKARQRNGNPPLEIVGWVQTPRYAPATHTLE